MSDDEILYHYCSNDTFLKIIENKSLHLSSLDAANDSREGSWLIDKLEHVIESRGISEPSAVENMIRDFRARRSNTIGLAMCFSKEKDDLSQWRGYAEDAMGVSIGFNRKALQELVSKKGVIRLRKDLVPDEKPEPYLHLANVVYSEAEAEEWLNRWIDAEYDDGVLTNNATRNFGDALFRYKKTAFHKESEVRLFALGYMSLHWPWIQWKSRNCFMVPYVDFLAWIESARVIHEVWLGPRNQTNRKHLEAFLDHSGFPKVEVHKSSASYR